MGKLFEAKPYIVAEVGSNWQTREQAIASVGAAKAMGADCVKFQAFTYEALYGSDIGFRYRYSGDGVDTNCPYLPLDWLPALKEKADACGIDFACTAFSPELVAAVDPFVAWHKVASSDLCHPQLLQAIKAKKKPVILSTGASSGGDIRRALAEFQYWFDPNDEDYVADPKCPLIVLLYCISAYPAKTIDLDHLRLLRERFELPIGFSDHSIDIVGHPVEAARRGATVIEKHFTAFPELDTPDRPHSLTPVEFVTMVDFIRGVRRPVIGPTPEERDMLLRHNRRLLATRNIAEGETLEYGRNFGAYRSLVDDTRGLSPFAWSQLQGKRAKLAIERGVGIGPGDFA